MNGVLEVGELGRETMNPRAVDEQGAHPQSEGAMLYNLFYKN